MGKIVVSENVSLDGVVQDPAGERLFGATSDQKPMRLVGSQTVEDDVAVLTYERVRDA